ncbi:MAG TPA: histidine kinase [Conexibacter sp.]|nr:histidine kinase [Conexibacter sp.]
MSALQTEHDTGSIVSLAAAAERRRIERDLHDGAQTLLVSVRIKLGLAADRAAELDDPDLHRLLLELGDEAQAALDGVRTIAHGTYPPVLATRGLTAALAAEGARAAMPVRVVGTAPRSTPEHEAAVYYCCLEALQNAAKHAGPAACATVRLACAGEGLSFEVRDDGAGFGAAPQPLQDGGLLHMHQRVEAAGGELTICSRRGGGTSVRGRVPWPRPAAAA